MLQKPGLGTARQKAGWFALSLILTLALFVVAGCGGSEKSQGEETTGGSGETRMVTDAAGDVVEVPVEPRRVVALSEQYIDGMLALGLEPVGYVNGRGQAGPPAYLADQLEDSTSVGELNQPSVEAIVALGPDLILYGSIVSTEDDIIDEEQREANAELYEPILEQMRRIAPTVVTYAQDDDWKTAFRGTADALNEQDAARNFIYDYDRRVSEIRDELGSEVDSTASIVRWQSDGIYYMLEDAFASLILRDLGMQRPENQREPGYFPATPAVSFEDLERIDGGWIFAGTLNDDDGEALDEALQNPLVQRLDAVQNDHFIRVDGTIWGSRGGPLAAHIVLDEIRQGMVGD